MRRPWCGAILMLAVSGVSASDECHVLTDAAGDATVRRTDPGNDGALNALSVLPDVLSVSVCGWQPFNPVGDPFTGQTIEGRDADIFRLQLVLDGLVNPAGRVIGGNTDPFVFGPSPLIGFIDIDIDNKDSGGELGSAAESRYLANVGRFGRTPGSSLGNRAARSRADVDNDFYTTPQYERTGADFALVLCGCDEPSVVSEGGDADGTFEEGETWIVRSRLFERAQGYREASAAFGGSAPGLYDPFVDVRFSHDLTTDRTTVTVVWALTMRGAADLTGQPEQPIDLSVSNHVSAIEAIQDVIDGANIGGFSGPAWVLAERWRGREAEDFIDPSDWEVSALVGLPYLDQADGLYVWADTVGEEELFGDCDGDAILGEGDEALIRAEVYTMDGTAEDADGVRDGRWTLENPGFNFSLYDLDGDMVVTNLDLVGVRPLGDFNFDGTVNTQDFLAFLNAWVAGETRADFDFDQTVNSQDVLGFLNAWVGS